MSIGPALARAGALLAAGVTGGAIALAGASLVDDGSRPETTVVREVVPSGAGGRLPDGTTINDIYERAKAGVVQINTTSIVSRVVPDPFYGFGFPEQERRRGLGSGFVLDKSGHVVTNYHVVEDVHANSGEISLSFSNREGVRATIVGVDPPTDVAVLKVDQSSQALTPLDLGRSDTVRVGDPVVAIGNPFGFERTVTAGIVSALQRRIARPGEDEIDRVIQIDAAINEGNSGGPLLDRNGRVIGVNTAIFTSDPGERGWIGIGFSIPIDTVKEIAGQLIEHGKVERAYLGVGAQEIAPRIARLLRLPVSSGLLVTSVAEGSAADEAGIRPGDENVTLDGVSYPLGGDIIVAIDGRPISRVTDLRSAIAAKEPGDTIEVELVRDEGRDEVERVKLDVKLGRRTEAPSSD